MLKPGSPRPDRPVGDPHTSEGGSATATVGIQHGSPNDGESQ